MSFSFIKMLANGPAKRSYVPDFKLCEFIQNNLKDKWNVTKPKNFGNKIPGS